MSPTALAPSPPPDDSRHARRMRPLLGTYVEVAAQADDATRTDAALAAAFAVLEQAQQRWSFQLASSTLSALNQAGGRRVPVDRSTRALLRLARALMLASDGAFDITVGGELVRLGVLPDHGGPPALARGSAADIEIDGNGVRLARPLRLTLDGIAKGWAVDQAVAALRRAGARSGWVNAGGDLRAFGPLRLPIWRRQPDGQLQALGELQDAAVASSHSAAGPDPSFPARLLGRPGQALPAAVWTVLARSAWRADALTKVAACTAPAQRRTLVARLGGTLVEDPA